MGNIFGQFFRITTYGESHGSHVGVVIDGCPAGLHISEKQIQFELDRRKPGQSKLSTPRKEQDCVSIQSGIFQGVTLGTSIHLSIQNQDSRSKDYEHLKNLYRPSHADYTYEKRYGFRDWRGGGRASNRETIGRVAAGAIAKAILKQLSNIEILAYVSQIHNIQGNIDLKKIKLENIEANHVRCPDEALAKKMEATILDAKKNGNSLGGVIQYIIRNCPPGFGAPVFDKLTADISKALISIPATRSIQIGIGEKSILMKGSEHNDSIVVDENKQISTKTNYAGGIVGGISNGENICGSVSFKPTATIHHEQETVTQDLKPVLFKGKGRHDPCVLPRAVPIVEAMISLVLVDHLLSFSIATMDRLKKIFE